MPDTRGRHRPQRFWTGSCRKRGPDPAVILRKASQSNRSDKGAATQAILMSVFCTLELRGHHPNDALVSALKTYVTTGQLPALPASATTDG